MLVVETLVLLVTDTVIFVDPEDDFDFSSWPNLPQVRVRRKALRYRLQGKMQHYFNSTVPSHYLNQGYIERNRCKKTNPPIKIDKPTSLGSRQSFNGGVDHWHYSDVIMGVMAYSTVYSGADQRKHQSSVSLAFVRGIHRWPVNSSRKRPVTRKMFPFDDVIMGKHTTHLAGYGDSLSWARCGTTPEPLTYLTPLRDLNAILISNCQANVVNWWLSIAYEIAGRWLSQELAVDKSALVQVMT